MNMLSGSRAGQVRSMELMTAGRKFYGNSVCMGN